HRDRILPNVELRLIDERRHDVDDLLEDIRFDLPLEQSSLPRNSLGNPVTCYKGSRGLSPDSVFPPGVLTLHASVDARRRFVRGPGLPHHPERLVMSALRAFDARLRQRFRDLLEDEGLGGL